jgi:bifunctional lysine-specific demethylase and histidyl-hydroxylase MINA
MDYALGLEGLIHPVARSTFFDEHFESKWLYIDRRGEDHFGDLLTLDDVDRLLTHSNFRTTEVFVIDAGRPVTVEDFTNPAGAIDPAKVYRLHAEGSTVILNRINNYHPPLADLCASMDTEFGATCGANVYVTPPQAQGFGAHFDTHDVFILQLSGTKRWTLYGTPVVLPVAGHGDEGPQREPGEPTAQIDLQPGDTLYIPRGTVHDARSYDDVSVHVTLGIFSFTWADLLLESLASAVLEDPTYRRSLPSSFVLGPPDPADARPVFDELVQHFADTVDLRAAMDSLREQFLARRGTTFRGQMMQLAQSRELAPESRLVHRPHLLYSLRRDGEQIRLRCCGNETTFPQGQAQLLDFALGTSSFRLRDVPSHLQDESTVAVIQRLIHSGALKVDATGGNGSLQQRPRMS